MDARRFDSLVQALAERVASRRLVATGLFAAAMKLTASSESELDKEPVKAPEADSDAPEVAEPEKADA